MIILKSNEKYMILRSILIVLVVFMIGCAGQKKQSAKMIVEMSKSACMGPCPVYSIQIYDDGLVKLEGEKHIEQIGQFKAYLSEEQLVELKQRFVEVDIFNLQDVYTKKVMDLPTTKITYVEGERSKKITDYYGAPEELKSLENYVHGYLEKLDWKSSAPGSD